MFNRPKQPECTFYIHEFALRTTVGSRQVMYGQIMHLAFMANTYGVSIRIIPTDLGPNASFKGPFMRMDYGDEDLPVVYVEHQGVSMFMDEAAVVEGHAVVLKSLDRIALDEGQSRLWLVNLASEYDQPGDDPHALGLPDLA